MMPLMVDCSWGSAYETPTLIAPSCAPALESAFFQSHPKSGSDKANASSQRPLYPNGFHINDNFRVAVPNEPKPPDPCAPTATAARNLFLAHHIRKDSTAGRKRSCAEISDDDESSSRNTTSSGGASSGSPGKDEDEAMSGPGMAGTFADELAERLRSSSVEERKGVRPHPGVSRKSIRLDPGACFVDLAGHGDGQQRVTAPGHDTAPRFAHTPPDVAFPGTAPPPTHDAASLALGVGWSSIPVNPTMSAAARGWAKYIETAFPLRSAKVVWRNEGMGAFLASAVAWDGSPGYFLFDEELTQGRLVAKSWERCLDGLRSQPFAFEGEATLGAGELGNSDHGANEVMLDEPNMVKESQDVVMEVDC